MTCHGAAVHCRQLHQTPGTDHGLYPADLNDGGVSLSPCCPLSNCPNWPRCKFRSPPTTPGPMPKPWKKPLPTCWSGKSTALRAWTYITSSSTNTGQSNISVGVSVWAGEGYCPGECAEQSGGGRTSAAPRGESAGDYGRCPVSQYFAGVPIFFTDDDRYDGLFLNNYADLFILDEVKRIRGVGNAEIFGARQICHAAVAGP